MSQNLLDVVQRYFGGDTVRQTSTALGESESSTGTALRSIVPLVLGALFARTQQPGGTAELFGLARQAHSSGILGNLGSLLSGTGSAATLAPATGGSLPSRGMELLRSVLGPQYTPVVDGVSQQAGIRTVSASSLLGMAAPVVLGLLGRHASENNLDEAGFGSYLNGQRGSILGALGSLPAGLGNLLSGLGLGAAAMASPVQAAAHRTGEAARTIAREGEAAVATPSRWPWLLLLLLALAALWYFMRSCNSTPNTAAPTATEAVSPDTNVAAPPAAPTAPTGRYDAATGNYIYDTGTSQEVRLPDGTVLTVGAASFEARLFNFLNDASQTVSTDKTQGWMRASTGCTSLPAKPR